MNLVIIAACPFRTSITRTPRSCWGGKKISTGLSFRMTFLFKARLVHRGFSLFVSILALGYMKHVSGTCCTDAVYEVFHGSAGDKQTSNDQVSLRPFCLVGKNSNLKGKNVTYILILTLSMFHKEDVNDCFTKANKLELLLLYSRRQRQVLLNSKPKIRGGKKSLVPSLSVGEAVGQILLTCTLKPLTDEDCLLCRIYISASCY